MDVHVIDGGTGEGGGQVLRSALALSLVTGRPFRIERIRAGRQRPGLLRQHLTCVRAAAEIGGGETEGAELGSSTLSFRPGRVRPGSYRFAVGTAGSVALVLQSVLPALLVNRDDAGGGGEFELVLEGGTHADHAPPFEFLDRAFLPVLSRMGANASITLERCGFFPAGGGRMTARVRGGELRPIELPTRGAVTRRHARAFVSNLPFDIATREIDVLRRGLDLAEDEARGETVVGSPGPGNAIVIAIESEHSTEIISAFGSVKRSAEAVAHDAVAQARRFLGADVPVGEHLCDQLLLPLALAGGGSFRTMPPTQHSRTNAEIIHGFLGTSIRFTEESSRAWRCEVNGV